MGQVVGLKRSLAQILILALALEVFALMSPLLMQWTVDFAIVTADRDLVTLLVLGFGLLMLVQTAIGLMRSWVVLYMSAHLNLQWVANVFTQLLRLPVSYFEKRHLGDVVSRFGAVGQIQQTLTTSFIEALLDGLMAVATLGMMLVYSLQFATVVMVSIALYGALRGLVYRPFGAPMKNRSCCRRGSRRCSSNRCAGSNPSSCSITKISVAPAGSTRWPMPPIAASPPNK